MPDLSFTIEGAEVVKFSASPLLAFKLRVTNANPAETIHSVALRSQIQIEVTRRRYTGEEQEKLLDLFGEPDRWSQTLRNLLWTHVNVNVPPFKGSTVVDLPVPCTFDFNVGATKYFHGLGDGEVPLYLIDAKGSTFVAQVFAAGLLASLGHDPKIAIRDFQGEVIFTLTSSTIESASLKLNIQADSLEVADDISDKDRQEIHRKMCDEALESMLQSEETRETVRS